MGEHRGLVALIVPASNSVMEPDFHRACLPGVAVSTWRIFLEDVSRAAEERMLDVELPRCLPHIEHTGPDVVVFGCTSAGSLGGIDHDRALARGIHDGTGAPVVTVVDSMLAELAAHDAHRVAVLTPYREDLTASVAACVAEGGHEVVATCGMGILDNRDIGRVRPSEIVAFARDSLTGIEADAVFLSCTNWRAIEALDVLSEELGVPVLSSNQVTLAGVRRALAA